MAMTNIERIQVNNAELRKAIEVAENLPDAGGGVAKPVIEPLAITENGTYTASKGVDGYSPVTVNVPVPEGYIQPSGTLEVTENGQHDVTEYESVNVNVPTGGSVSNIGGITQYAKTTATTTSANTMTIINPLGGLAKKVSLYCPPDSETATTHGLVQKYSIDTTIGYGVMQLLNASTGNVTLYGSSQKTSISSNSQFSVSEGRIVLRSYNSTSCIWDPACEYIVEIWQ